MDRVPWQQRQNPGLYPPIEPFEQHRLDMGDGHVVHVERCGNPDGIPVVVLHGGPGGGISPAMRRYFDPARWHVVLFDQRGCGRSTPNAKVAANTTWHLVADIERIRQRFGIDRWAVFGGSWGATLGLVYAQEHPDRVRALFLRGVFLGTRRELDWFYGGGAGAFWPDLWADFAGMVPEDERDDLIAAYHRRLFSGDRAEEGRFARAWAGWENALASIESNGARPAGITDHTRAFARLENHYFFNNVFLSPEQQILNRMERIADIPGVIVQGRHDMICPPISAWTLAQAWPRARLAMVARAGHAMSEPGITAELLRSVAAAGERGLP